MYKKRETSERENNNAIREAFLGYSSEHNEINSIFQINPFLLKVTLLAYILQLRRVVPRPGT